MSSELAVIDARSPKEAISNLKGYVDDVYLFSSSGISYNSISGHPDIFLFQDSNKNILAPNAPMEFIQFLESKKIDFTFGKSFIGDQFSNSVQFNCLSNESYFFHKKGFTDEIINNHVKNKIFIELPQAYTRCSMISLGKGNYVTSDKGIQKVLEKQNLNCFYFSAEDIRIIDHQHGFFGGTCGISGNKIFFNGDIRKHKKGTALETYIQNIGYQPIYLHNDYLYDGGGIFFFGSMSE